MLILKSWGMFEGEWQMKSCYLSTHHQLSNDKIYSTIECNRFFSISIYLNERASIWQISFIQKEKKKKSTMSCTILKYDEKWPRNNERETKYLYEILIIFFLQFVRHLCVNQWPGKCLSNSPPFGFEVIFFSHNGFFLKSLSLVILTSIVTIIDCYRYR